MQPAKNQSMNGFAAEGLLKQVTVDLIESIGARLDDLPAEKNRRVFDSLELGAVVYMELRLVMPGAGAEAADLPSAGDLMIGLLPSNGAAREPLETLPPDPALQELGCRAAILLDAWAQALPCNARRRLADVLAAGAVFYIELQVDPAAGGTWSFGTIGADEASRTPLGVRRVLVLPCVVH